MRKVKTKLRDKIMRRMWSDDIPRGEDVLAGVLARLKRQRESLQGAGLDTSNVDAEIAKTQSQIAGRRSFKSPSLSVT